jgi:hypothetical protein
MATKWEPKAAKWKSEGGKGIQKASFAEQERKSEEKGAEKHAN